MQVRPLQRFRVYTLNDDGTINWTKAQPRYGDQSYLTQGMMFCIFAREGQWQISHHSVDIGTLTDVKQSGLLDTLFPRRRNAVEALEAVFGEVDASCK